MSVQNRKAIAMQPSNERVERLESQQRDILLTQDKHTGFLKELSTEQDSQSALLQTIFTMTGKNNTDIAVLKHEMEGARADITAIKATQSDHGELLRDMATKADIATLKATQDAHSKRMDTMDGKLDLILQLLQKKGE